MSASLVLADGKLYVTNKNAVTSVVATGPTFKLLSTNELDGSYALSTPAVSGDSIFIRTGKSLYRIRKNL